MFQSVLLYGKISVQFLLRSKSLEWQGFGRVADGVIGSCVWKGATRKNSNTRAYFQAKQMAVSSVDQSGTGFYSYIMRFTM